MHSGKSSVPDEDVARFLQAWFAVRQVIQAANFNHFHQAGLSATQFMTLNLLPAGDGTMSMGELARRMNLKAATVAKTVDSLEARGMLTRSKSPDDRRLVLIAITDQGRKLQNHAVGQFREHMTNIFTAMPAADREALIRGLESLVQVAGRGKDQADGSATPDGRGAVRAERTPPQSRRP